MFAQLPLLHTAPAQSPQKVVSKTIWLFAKKESILHPEPPLKVTTRHVGDVGDEKAVCPNSVAAYTNRSTSSGWVQSFVVDVHVCLVVVGVNETSTLGRWLCEIVNIAMGGVTASEEGHLTEEVGMVEGSFESVCRWGRTSTAVRIES
jgi:hypothetical protein